MDELFEKAKKKKWSDLSTTKKTLFIICLSAMAITLIYTGFNLEGLFTRTDIIIETNGCEYSFEEGILSKVDCPGDFELDNNDLIGTYTMVQYYEDRKPTQANYDTPFNLT